MAPLFSPNLQSFSNLVQVKSKHRYLSLWLFLKKVESAVLEQKYHIIKIVKKSKTTLKVEAKVAKI